VTISGLRCVIFLACAVLADGAAAEETCSLTPIGPGEVAAVRDGRTVVLRDGRQLRLKAIEVTHGTRAALERLAAGRALRLQRLGEDHDRYGRLVAFAFVENDPQSVQQRLVAQGQARVSARVGSRACAEPLLAAERAARAARRGLWADPNFAPLRAENLPGIRSQAGRFALVEGKVLSVHRSGGTFYLNFGQRWTRDFSVIILRRNQRSFAAAGMAPERLKGRTVRVRGFIEQRRGPVMVVDAPEQIEPMD
jgi:endonuclease YncB( thermonuclease family)